MNKSNVSEREDREGIADPLTELLREGAQQLIQQAVGAELEELLAQHGGRRTEAGTAGIAFCRDFFHWYNNVHYHSGLNWLTPAMVH